MTKKRSRYDRRNNTSYSERSNRSISLEKRFKKSNRIR